MKKVLIITSHRKDRAPNQRFRFEQYTSFLKQNGFHCTLSPLISNPEEDKLFYSRGNYLKKIPLGLKMGWRRINDVIRANRYDIILIAREAFIIGVPIFEKLLSMRKSKMVFDFDDAIWIHVISKNNRIFSWLKSGTKTSKIISYSNKIFAGNEYLANYALQFNKNVIIIPTTIDTDIYKPNYSIAKQKITIGWSGSVSTIEHFQFAIPALKSLKKKFGDKIDILVIGDGHFTNEELGILGRPWVMETELEDLQAIDIGIMPLPDNEWTWGKCGLKGLQYMSLEIPTVMSPVGVNKKIITDGENGFLAYDVLEWVNKISLLIEDPELRIRIGQEGRKTVINSYSVLSQQKRYLDQFNSLLSGLN